jgi:hypothetical protein
MAAPSKGAVLFVSAVLAAASLLIHTGNQPDQHNGPRKQYACDHHRLYHSAPPSFIGHMLHSPRPMVASTSLAVSARLPSS